MGQIMTSIFMHFNRQISYLMKWIKTTCVDERIEFLLLYNERIVMDASGGCDMFRFKFNAQFINSFHSSYRRSQLSSLAASSCLRDVTGQPRVQPIRHRFRSRLNGLRRRHQLGGRRQLSWQPQPSGCHSNAEQQGATSRCCFVCSAASLTDCW